MYRAYFTHYQRRSAFYYDPAAFRDVAESLRLEASPYCTRKIPQLPERRASSILAKVE